MPRRAPEGCVAGEERRSERLGERNVGSVVSREGAPKLPDARREDVVRIARQRESEEVVDGLGRAARREDSPALEAPEHLEDFEIEEMRRVKGDAWREEAAENLRRTGRVEQGVDDDGGVDDDQSGPLSRRTSAAPPEKRTGARASSRFRISSGVGRSAARRASVRR